MVVSKVLLAIVLISALLLSVAMVVVLSLITVYLPNRSVEPKTNTKSLRIAIVGAGISGLNAGLTLLDSNLFTGNNIVIYEADEKIGGRMHSKYWLPDNQTIEWCGEFLGTEDYTMLNLTKRFDISLLDIFEATDDSHAETFYYLRRIYNETEIWEEYKAIEGIIAEQRQQIGEINYNQSNSFGRYFDNLSLYDWIETYVPNGHQSLLGRFIDSEYRQEYGLDAQDLNSLVFITTTSNEGESPETPSGEHYRMRGGSGRLITRIAGRLTENGFQMQLNHNLTKIVKLTNGKYQLTFANGHRSVFDHVILTLPATTLRYVDYTRAQFDALKQRVINEIKYGTNTKLNLQFSERFWYDLSTDGGISTDLPFLLSWEISVGQAGNTGILVLLTGGAEGTAFTPQTAFDAISQSTSQNTSTSIFINKFLGELDEIWPNTSQYYTGEATVSAPWFSPYFLGSYPTYVRNQYSTIHRYESVRQGNAHFAGDYTSVDYFGYMEGAAGEGERAAREIIEDYS